MKARITPKKEIVLLYHHEQVKNIDKLLQRLEQMQIETRIVQESELGLTTGALAGYQSGASKHCETTEPPQTPAMAMGGLSGKRLDELLNAMQRDNVELPIKMVITPHNESWQFGKLIEEVSREHRLFLSMERLKALLDRVQNNADETAKPVIQQAKQALARMNESDDKQPDCAELDALSEQLQKIVG